MTGAAIITDRSRYAQTGRVDAIVSTPPAMAPRILQTVVPTELVALTQSDRRAQARSSHGRQALRPQQSP
jgi:hypothetical protein